MSDLAVDTGIVPVVMTEQGPLPQTPDTLRTQLVDLVTVTNPGYTANLPGTLIEDIASTDVGALILCDQEAVDLINSVTPYGANEFLLNQLGQIYGVPRGQFTNTSVSVIFAGDPGYVVQPGFIVSDGTYQYTVQDGGIVQTGGFTGELSCVAIQAGTWAVPANTVTQLITSVPSDVTLSVTNPLPGNPGTAAENSGSYRSRVLAAGLAASQGMPRLLKTALTNVPGVQARLVAVRQQVGGGWEILVGGGDQYAVANAIFDSVSDPSILVGSDLEVIAITNANPGEITTNLNHGFINGDVIIITGIQGMIELNDIPLTVTTVNEKQFTIGVDTSAFVPWISGGKITPNKRNVIVTVNVYPDSYSIPFVLPPLQTVEIVATWNTSLTNFVASAAVAQLAGPAIISYINSIPVGQPINILEMEDAFQDAIETVLAPAALIRLNFDVSINGIGTLPVVGTKIINGDPESYFFANTNSVRVVQG